MIFMGLSFAGLLLIGTPVAFCIGVSGLLGLWTQGNTPLILLPHMMVQGTDSFSLLAVPLFIFAGVLMNAGGITARLVGFANLVVGGIRGGLALVNVMASMLFAGITGAAVADTSAIGSVLIPAMKEQGYDPDYAAAITAASSTVGPIIPPSIPMIIYGVAAEQSIAALFLAGVFPGILIGLAFMLMAYRRGGGMHPSEEGPTGRRLLSGLKDAFFALLMPVLILGSIFAGLCTPTEAAAIAVLYALLVGGLVYRQLSWKQLPALMRQSSVITAVILYIIASAALFGWLMAASQVPEKIVALTTGVSTHRWVVLLLLNLFLLAVGTFMETTASLIILTPVLLPLAAEIGIHPIHFGAIMVLNLVIGLITPPLGVCLFVSSTIAGISLERISRAVLPFVLAAIVVLLIVTYIPALSVWLPHLYLQR